jgi:hypothetical protein
VYALQASKANILGIDRHALSVGEPSVLDWLINSVDNVTDYLSRLVGLYEPPISPEGVARDLTPKELQHNVASIESCISMLLIISPDADHGISSSVNSSSDSRMGLQKKCWSDRSSEANKKPKRLSDSVMFETLVQVD